MNVSGYVSVCECGYFLKCVAQKTKSSKVLYAEHIVSQIRIRYVLVNQIMWGHPVDNAELTSGGS